jgi:lipid-binding SYLF domain-containing protein
MQHNYLMMLNPRRIAKEISMRRLFPLMLVTLLWLPLQASAGQKEDQRADNSVRVLSEILRIPEDSVPTKLLQEAAAIAVIPDVVKAGFVVGGRHGKGVIAVRGEDGTWSNPSFIKLNGGSIGFQAGVQSADVILVFRNKRGVDSIANGKFTLGADASVAAGPVGRSAQASTDEQLKAEILSYSRARGLFAGVSIDGAVLSMDHKANAATYGAGTTPRMIFEGRVEAPSEAVVNFRDKLEESTAKPSTASK